MWQVRYFQQKFTLLGRLHRVDLIKWVSDVRPPVRSSSHPSTNSFFKFNEI